MAPRLLRPGWPCRWQVANPDCTALCFCSALCPRLITWRKAHLSHGPGMRSSMRLVHVVSLGGMLAASGSILVWLGTAREVPYNSHLPCNMQNALC